MATTDLLLRLNRDAFRDPNISKEELARRLTELVESLYDMLTQVQGTRIENNTNITIYGSTGVTPTGLDRTVVAFEVNGKTIELTFTGGLLTSASL